MASYKDGQRDRWNRIESPDFHSRMNDHLIYEKDSYIVSEERMIFLVNSDESIGYPNR